ncbi:restriction endonuclease subunit S [Streptococcus agalactiae]|nr:MULTISPECIES: restriction endonuclease subunit S [Streptococcus]MBY5058600.1 restriction endonuclease subunit S [Streptococcus agalactiae]MCB2845267.1 restriction endonuclease subunit S [Streptococcus dysgalactiae subsp. dysgalactiae]
MRYKLGEVAKIRYGKDHKKLDDGNIPVYGSGGIMRYVDTALYDKKSVLIPRKGSLGNLFFANKPFWTVDTLFYTEIDENILMPEFLFYKLKMFNLASMNVGSAVPSLTTAILNALELDIPSFEVQSQIVNILKAFDERISLNKQINHHLLEQARLLYKNLISSNDTKYQNLSDIARITMGQSPKGETYNDDKIGLPLLNGATDFRNSISPSKWTSDPRKIARPGEYVFGVRATIGLTTKIFKEYAIGRGTGSAKPISNIFDEYLFFALEDLFDYYANLGSGTVYINISKSDFDSFKVILPIKDQFLVDFHKTVQPLFNLIFNNNAEIQKLSELRDCLLPKLLPGEISINQATK